MDTELDWLIRWCSLCKLRLQRSCESTHEPAKDWSGLSSSLHLIDTWHVASLMTSMRLLEFRFYTQESSSLIILTLYFKPSNRYNLLIKIFLKYIFQIYLPFSTALFYFCPCSHILVNVLLVGQGVSRSVRNFGGDLVGTGAWGVELLVAVNGGPLASSETERGSRLFHLVSLINIRARAWGICLSHKGGAKLSTHWVGGGLRFSRISGGWVGSGAGNWLDKLLSVVMSNFSSHVELRLLVLESHAGRLVGASTRN